MKRFCIAFLLLFVLATVSSAHADVVLKPQSDIDRPSIRLSDIFENLPQGIDRDIASAPSPGNNVTYDTNVLARLSQAYRLNWQPQSILDKSVIARISRDIPQEDLRDAVARKVHEVAGETRDDRIEVAFDNKNLIIHLASDQDPLFTFRNFTYEPVSQRFHTDIIAGRGNGTVIMTVGGRVSLRRDVPVLAHRMEAGAVVSDADISYLTISSDHLPQDLLTDATNIIGHALRREIPDNIPLRSRDLTQPKLVSRGTLVMMKVQTPYLQVTAQGRALSDGTLGDIVRLTNIQSNRTVEGKVIGENLVSIQTTSNSIVSSAAQVSVVR